MTWKSAFNEGKELILSTASKKCIPNSIVVISLGFIEGKLLIANCQMNVTAKNIKGNKNVCVISGYFKIKGDAKIQHNGKYFDLCKEKSKGFKVKNAIIISPKEVYNLDKVKKIF
jgi:hypothetical protein